MHHITILIDGMTCAGCVASAKRALAAVPGVASAEVSLERRQAIIACDQDRVPAERLVGALADAGFRARPA